ncbi:MAG TPA: ATP-binding protein [Streptosporangiaceae bacterium]|nr:ATP-binding protein [Streptosporangiaceae bacterium]
MTQPKPAGGVAGGTPLTAKFCLTFQREPLSVPVTRHVLGSILHSVGVDDTCVSDLLLASTEACSNVLRHGGPRVTGYAVVVTIEPARCQVEIAGDTSFGGIVGPDPGRRAVGAGRQPGPTRGLRLPARRLGLRGGPARGGGSADRRRGTRQTDVAGLAESGRGLDVMRACVDDVSLRTRPGRGTVVTMRKQIAWATDAPLTRLRAAS